MLAFFITNNMKQINLELFIHFYYTFITLHKFFQFDLLKNVVWTACELERSAKFDRYDFISPLVHPKSKILMGLYFIHTQLSSDLRSTQKNYFSRNNNCSNPNIRKSIFFTKKKEKKEIHYSKKLI